MIQSECLFRTSRNLRNFLAGFNVAWRKECDFRKAQILMLKVHANWDDVGWARMVEEAANVSIEVGINAMLEESNLII